MSRETQILERKIFTLESRLTIVREERDKYKDLARSRITSNAVMRKEIEQLNYKYEAAKQRAEGAHLPKQTMMNAFLMSKLV